ncbi:hypothetical protein [Nostocoides vanveenii]|uniref:Uncharacterized protein n=1 Tax=Nostocoides vanveenii TaxID=330835 RepID=A0ABN2L2T3_9MICO
MPGIGRMVAAIDRLGRAVLTTQPGGVLAAGGATTVDDRVRGVGSASGPGPPVHADTAMAASDVAASRRAHAW